MICFFVTDCAARNSIPTRGETILLTYTSYLQWNLCMQLHIYVDGIPGANCRSNVQTNNAAPAPKYAVTVGHLRPNQAMQKHRTYPIPSTRLDKKLLMYMSPGSDRTPIVRAQQHIEHTNLTYSNSIINGR